MLRGWIARGVNPALESSAGAASKQDGPDGLRVQALAADREMTTQRGEDTRSAKKGSRASIEGIERDAVVEDKEVARCGRESTRYIRVGGFAW